MPSRQAPAAQPAWPDALSEVAKHNIVTNESNAVGKLVATTADGPMKSVVTARWHLIVHKELGDQLYDWVHDPGEINNLINTPDGRQAARGLDSRLEALLARSTGRQPAPTSIALRDGRFNIEESSVHANRPGGGASPATDDSYRMEAQAGSTLTVEVRARRLPVGPAGSGDRDCGREWAALPNLQESRRRSHPGAWTRRPNSRRVRRYLRE